MPLIVGAPGAVAAMVTFCVACAAGSYCVLPKGSLARTWQVPAVRIVKVAEPGVDPDREQALDTVEKAIGSPALLLAVTVKVPNGV